MHSSSSLNKLQAKKSSFQAWKCASFGFALFALILLVSKWHEVSTDYNLLTNIDHLIWAQNQARLSAPANASAQSTRVAVSQQTTPPAFPQQNGPASLWAGTTLGGQNKSVSSEEGAQNNQAVSSKETPLQTTDTDQHLQLLLGREQNGNELLRRELESFLGEFRSAKSTLCLSSLLVSVYIVSWILMTLAVNDTAISNDVSLRNIVLLSVFGAIDMAASVGFVMVRVIMFNVKNNSFMLEIIGSSGLRDTPVSLSADQLASFTSLRLIAMRSCSAFVDIYVSAIVALLTLLRLYSIIKAISYYRLLRRHQDMRLVSADNSTNHRPPDQHQISYGMLHSLGGGVSFLSTTMNNGDQQPLVACSSGSETSARNLPSLVSTTNASNSTSVWPANLYASNQRQLSQQQQQHQQQQRVVCSRRQMRAVPQPQISQNDILQGEYMAQTSLPSDGGLTSQNQRETNQKVSRPVERDKDQNDELRQQPKRRQMEVNNNLELGEENIESETDGNNNNTNNNQPDAESQINLKPSARQQRQLHKQLNRLLLDQQRMLRGQQEQKTSLGKAHGPPSVLMVNGRAHRLVAASVGSHAGEESQLRKSGNSTNSISRRLEPSSTSGSCRDKASWPGQQMNSSLGRPLCNMDAQARPATSFTLLSSRQLERLARKLQPPERDTSMIDNQQQELGGPKKEGSIEGRYKLVARYRPAMNGAMKHEEPLAYSLEERDKEQVSSSSALSSASSESSSCTASEDNDSDAPASATTRAITPEEEPPGRGRAGKAMRLTEMLVSSKQPVARGEKRNRRQVLLDKYYYA